MTCINRWLGFVPNLKFEFNDSKPHRCSAEGIPLYTLAVTTDNWVLRNGTHGTKSRPKINSCPDSQSEARPKLKMGSCTERFLTFSI